MREPGWITLWDLYRPFYIYCPPGKPSQPRCYHYILFFAPGSTRCQDLPANLVLVLEDVVRMINFLKARPLKTTYSHLCVRKWERSIKSYSSTEVWWLSQHRVLARVYESWEELKVFLTNERCDDAKLHASDECCTRLAYIEDTFQHLNELNTWMQGQ